MTAESEDRGILDTNIVLLLPQLTDPTQLPHDPAITSVTLAELSVGPLVASTVAERARRQAHLQQAESDFDVVPFDADAARVFGRVAADLRNDGRKPAARAYDALIAATSIANQMPLYTANPDDYRGISGLDLVPVPHPSQP